MENSDISLKRVIGAIVFAARQPLTSGAIRKVLQEAAEVNREEAGGFGAIKESEIKSCLQQLQQEFEGNGGGVHLVEGADGFRYQSDPAAGPWVRHMLNVGKPSRMSRPALETLAIIAYRQPISRAELEGVRGVTVDHVIRMLMEMQLIRITGRSELPGRPMLYGTTDLFLEHFGLKDIKDLPGINELARFGSAAAKKPAKQEESGEGEVPAADREAAPQADGAKPQPPAGSKEAEESEDEPLDEDDLDEDDEEDEEGEDEDDLEDEDDEEDDEDEGDEDDDEDEEGT